MSPKTPAAKQVPGVLSITVEHAIAVLNRIAQEDEDCLRGLVEYRLPCNDALAEDETVQVGPTDPDDPNCETYQTGLLGIINGIFGIREDGYGYISVLWNENDTIAGFELTPDDVAEGE